MLVVCRLAGLSALETYYAKVRARAQMRAEAIGQRASVTREASENGYPRDLAERALAHTVKNQVEAAYHRTDLLEQRRAMMEAWSAHVEGLVGA